MDGTRALHAIERAMLRPMLVTVLTLAKHGASHKKNMAQRSTF